MIYNALCRLNNQRRYGMYLFYNLQSAGNFQLKNAFSSHFNICAINLLCDADLLSCLYIHYTQIVDGKPFIFIEMNEEEKCEI